MPLYSYQAFSKDGKKVTGSLDASSPTAVKEYLIKQGMFPVAIALGQGQAAPAWYQQFLTKKVSTKDKILFTKQLATLLKAGIPLLQSLELLTEQFTGVLKNMIISIKDDIKEGSSLANAMSKYPHVFDTIYIQLVRAGEASGKLEVILDRLTTLLEKQEALRKKISGALTYPIIQLAVAVCVVVILLTFVVPKVTESFVAQKKALPTATRILLAISNVFTTYYWLLGIVIIIAVVAFRYWKSTPSGARTFDQMKLKIPIFGYFTQLGAVVQFSQTLGMLMESGVNLAESLDIVCNIIDNRILADTLREARDKIIKQGKIAQYLKQTGIFPPIAIYMISTGEQSGQLDQMLLTVARNYEEELGEVSEKLTALLGPALLIVMALVVGFILAAVAQPIMGMAGSVAGI